VTKKTYDILVICRSIFYKGLDGDTINLESPSEKALYRILLTSETQKNKSGAVIAAFASLLSSNLSLCYAVATSPLELLLSRPEFEVDRSGDEAFESVKLKTGLEFAAAPTGGKLKGGRVTSGKSVHLYNTTENTMVSGTVGRRTWACKSKDLGYLRRIHIW